MKIRIIGADRLVLANDGIRVVVWEVGSEHQLDYHQAQPFIESGWAELAFEPLGGSEHKVVAPSEPARKKRR